MEIAGVTCAALHWSVDTNTVIIRWNSLYYVSFCNYYVIIIIIIIIIIVIIIIIIIIIK